MSEPISVCVVSIGGYGEYYVQTLLAAPADSAVVLVGAVDPAPERCGRLAELRAAGVPIYADLGEFYAAGPADLVVMAPPIHLHEPLSRQALENGSSVLCEKPLAGSPQQARRMAQCERQAGKSVAIGYQWSFSEAIQSLKRDILAGRLGRPVRMKTLVCWPRPQRYYARNHWAGKLRMPDGRWVLDSPTNNATAHHLHNMFYLLGPTRTTSAMPVEVQAELYRANPIDSHDTAALRCRTASGTEVLFYTTHASASSMGPIMSLQFEDATVHYDQGACDRLIARFKDGTVRDYGAPGATDEMTKLWACVEAMRGGAAPACGIAAALPQTVCAWAAQESAGHVGPFPDELVRVAGRGPDSRYHLPGLETSLAACYNRGVLPAEHGGLPWAVPGNRVGIREDRSATDGQ